MSIFSQVPIFVPKTNKINLSHQNLLTTSFGKVTPCLVEECLPGDVFKVKSEVFTRFQPLLAPIMDRCDVSIHYFFFPTRLGYSHFYNFLTGDEMPNGTPAVLPFAYLDDIAQATFSIKYSNLTVSEDNYGKHLTYSLNGTLMDYLGLPSGGFFDVYKASEVAPIEITNYTPRIPVNMLPFIAYYRIWEKYYRDENLYDVQEINEALRAVSEYGGDIKSYTFDSDTLLDRLVSMRLRAYKKDYFTSALPWSQKGNEVLLPIGQQEVQFYGSELINTPESVTAATKEGATSRLDLATEYGNVPVTAKTAGVTTTTINDLRTAMRVQQLLENNARGGTRQQEFIKAHWGVYAKDARINDPEYIGGATTPVQISEVLSQVANQAAGSASATNALGQLGGHGISAGFGTSKKYRVTEHGYLVAVLSIMPKSSYFQGIPRMYSHLAMYDFFFPELSHLGEQEIKNKELVVEPTSIENGADMEGTFGYTPRYAEYKYHPNEVHGDFRDSLKYWHTARIFDYTPGLNADFITCNPSDQGQNRIFTYQNADYDQILIQIYHHNPMLRKMPYFGIPKF